MPSSLEQNAVVEITPTGAATGVVYLDDRSPIRIFGNDKIRATFDPKMLRQTVAARRAPGIANVAFTPDAHVGYGAPVGCVMISPTHVYPGSVGVDVNCSMCLLQLDLSKESLQVHALRRALIKAISARVSVGVGTKLPHKDRMFLYKTPNSPPFWAPTNIPATS